MAEVDLINFFVGFFINDLFGSYIFGTLFLIILVFMFITIANTPKAAWLILPTILVMGFTTEGFVPEWVAVMMWIGMGLLWGLFVKELVS